MTDEVSAQLRYNEEDEVLAVYFVNGDEEEFFFKTSPEELKTIVETYNAKHPEVKVVIEEVKPAEQVVAPIAAGPAAVEPVKEEPVVAAVAPVVEKPADEAV